MLGKDINDLVIVKLEEYTPFGQQAGTTLLAGGDSLDEVKPIYSYIAQHLAEAGNEILLTAPLGRLHYTDLSATATADADTQDAHTGSITKPTDYLRLHTLRMSCWMQPRHKAVHIGDAEYTLQFNAWTRGTKQKPVVVETNDALLYFSVDESNHTIGTFSYIPQFSDSQEYDREVAELIALHCARKVCEVFGMTEQITVFTTEINSVLENIQL